MPAAVLAGLGAVFFYTRRTTDSIQSADGVQLGTAAGVAGGILCAIESFFTKSSLDRLNSYDLMPGMHQTAEAQATQFFVSILWASMWLLTFLVPAVIGGLIGAQLFRKPATNTTLPPTHNQ